MGLQIPGELRSLLDILGYDWPASDEQKLFELGQAWLEFSDEMAEFLAGAVTAATNALAGNEGGDVEAFRNWWAGAESPTASLVSNVTGSVVGGAGLIICAAIVLALKIAVIVQLTILAIQIAQAIATAGPTFGASLLEIPVFQTLARTIVGNLMQEAVWRLIDG
ncbi:WXG100-like domain-containing protein [Micromonospora sp. IBHARD004]|uniref:WXG100-like domain-containing protein n=1 Tax=Micromonospora sp. IBHARD004 TaxID=3457764 RepID=UPI0040595F1D